MNTAELVEQLKQMSNADRMAIIDVASRLVRAERERAETQQDERLQAAALSVKDLYEFGGDHTEWTALDAEDFRNESLAR